MYIDYDISSPTPYTRNWTRIWPTNFPHTVMPNWNHWRHIPEGSTTSLTGKSVIELYKEFVDQKQSELSPEIATWREDDDGDWNLEVSAPGYSEEDVSVSFDDSDRSLIVVAKSDRGRIEASRTIDENFEPVDVTVRDGLIRIKFREYNKVATEPRTVPLRGASKS